MTTNVPPHLLSPGERERGAKHIFDLSPARQAEVRAAMKAMAAAPAQTEADYGVAVG